MSLQVWLPLIGTLENKGLKPLTINTVDTTITNDGKLGPVYNFSANTSVIRSAASECNITREHWSVGCWFYQISSSASAHQWMVGIHRGSTASAFQFMLCSYRNALSLRCTGTTRNGPSISLNKWHHGMAVYDGTNLYFYLDGTLSLTTTLPTTQDATAATLIIGNRLNNAGAFQGKIQDVRIYDNALSAAEVKEIAQGLIIHYKLNDTSNNSIVDSSGYSHHGALINSPTTSSDTPRYNASITLTSANSQTIKVEDNTWMVQGSTEFTINLWAKSASWTGAHLFSCTETGGFNTETGSSGYLRFPIHVYTDEEKTTTAYQYTNTGIKISDLSTTDWQMFTFVYNNTGTYIYINGNLYKSYSFTSYGVHYNTDARLFLGCEANVAQPKTPYFNGQLSDFRFYCTSLLDTDIKLLYNTSMRIDKLKNVHTFEVIENNENNISKNGTLNCNEINEFNSLTNVQNQNDGDWNAIEFIER